MSGCVDVRIGDSPGVFGETPMLARRFCTFHQTFSRFRTFDSALARRSVWKPKLSAASSRAGVSAVFPRRACIWLRTSVQLQMSQIGRDAAVAGSPRRESSIAWQPRRPHIPARGSGTIFMCFRSSTSITTTCSGTRSRISSAYELAGRGASCLKEVYRVER